MEERAIREMVRSRYAGIAGNASCCGAAEPDLAEKSRRIGYSEAELEQAGEGANLGLGCGNPQAIASLRPGEVVVDLGSGAGFDCFLAARAVGPTGRVIGVDMTAEMLARARTNAARLGLANVEFREGDLVSLPLPDAIADVIISNCVINLVPEKEQVFREAFRVLKRGGRLAVADVVNIAPLPPDLAADPALLCGCVAGAAPIADLEAMLEAAGFAAIRIEPKPGSRETIASWAPGRGIEACVASASVTALKPPL
jgi:SAM-dependent methyltransferase